MNKYHEVRSHILHCLDTRAFDPYSKTFKLVKTYLALVEIEHVTGQHQARDLHLQQALSFANSIEEVRDVVCQDIQRILMDIVYLPITLSCLQRMIYLNSSVIVSHLCFECTARNMDHT